MERLQAEVHYSRINIEKSKPTDSAKQRTDLEARRRKLGIALADDAISEDDYRRRMDAIKRDLAKLDDEVAVEGEWTGFSPRTPLVDWTADDATVGEQLRRVVRVVRLGADMRPAEVELRVRRSRTAA
jgi:hypothetical protein